MNGVSVVVGWNCEQFLLSVALTTRSYQFAAQDDSRQLSRSAHHGTSDPIFSPHSLLWGDATAVAKARSLPNLLLKHGRTNANIILMAAIRLDELFVCLVAVRIFIHVISAIHSLVRLQHGVSILSIDISSITSSSYLDFMSTASEKMGKKSFNYHKAYCGTVHDRVWLCNITISKTREFKLNKFTFRLSRKRKMFFFESIN